MKIDLTKIDKPFGELDQQTQWMLRGAHAAGEVLEMYNPYKGLGFHIVNPPKFYGHITYRLKPQPVEHTATWDMGVAASEESAPIIGFAFPNRDFVLGKATVEMIDGKATSVVWKADE